MPSMRSVRLLDGLDSKTSLSQLETQQNSKPSGEKKPLASIFLKAAQNARKRKTTSDSLELSNISDEVPENMAEPDIKTKSDSTKPKSPAKKRKRKSAKEESYPCTFCDNVFPKRWALKAHIKIHNDKNVVCEICDMKFINKVRLEMHMRSHLGIRVSTLTKHILD